MPSVVWSSTAPARPEKTLPFGVLNSTTTALRLRNIGGGGVARRGWRRATLPGIQISEDPNYL